MVKITFRGPIAMKMGTPHHEVELNATERLGDILRRLILDKEEVREVWKDVQLMEREALILRNEVDIGLTGGLDTTIENDDSIVILPLVHGG